MSEQPMLWVHATINDKALLVAVAMRDRETLEEAMGRGVVYLLDDSDGQYATDVWSETMDRFEMHRFDPLMDGQFPGELSETGMRKL